MKRLDDPQVSDPESNPAIESRLSRRISYQLMRIIRTYVILLTVLVMVIMVLAGFFYNRNEIEHERERHHFGQGPLPGQQGHNDQG